MCNAASKLLWQCYEKCCCCYYPKTLMPFMSVNIWLVCPKRTTTWGYVVITKIRQRFIMDKGFKLPAVVQLWLCAINYWNVDNQICGCLEINQTLNHIPFFIENRWTRIHEENHPLKIRGGVWPDNSPLTGARVLIDAVSYVCSESVKCDHCLPQTLGDESTLSLEVTLNQD